MRPPANYWIEKLQLTPHLEGGYYKEIYRSGIFVDTAQLPHSNRNRSLSTSIYFLLKQGQFSAFHRIASDEQWHFYFGDPLLVYELSGSGICTEHYLGYDTENNGSFQCVIKAGNWFGARPAAKSEYCLVGCTVAPGFEYEDLEIASNDVLISQFPAQANLIASLTR
jgi:predicted cupin superfamily sugar epimerase